MSAEVCGPVDRGLDSEGRSGAIEADAPETMAHRQRGTAGWYGSSAGPESAVAALSFAKARAAV